MKPNPHIVFSVGDVSADQYIADMLPQLTHRLPNATYSGLGGTHMQAAGVEILMDMTSQGIAGVVEVIRYLPWLRRAWRTLTHHLQQTKPDLLILADYSGFNLRIARFAKALNIKILYYISPQVWAWKRHRLQLIRQYVDHMAVILPFEIPIYQQAQVPVTFVGHPLTQRAHSNLSRDQAAAELGLQADRKIIGLLPGSRRVELNAVLSLLTECARELHARYPQLQFVTPVSSSFTPEMIQAKLPDDCPPIRMITNRMYDVLACCDAAIVTSGTATLETALMGVPQVIIYKMSPITYWIVKRKILKQRMDFAQHFGLCNLIAGKIVAPEFVQGEATSTNVVAEIRQYLEDEAYNQHNKQQLQKLHQQLATQSVECSLAELIESLLS
jgi:lipid-A-disaccharide synthase